MKRFSISLILCLFGLVLGSHAAVTALGSMSTINNTTTNSPVLQTNTMTMAVGTFIISNGGLASTNALSGVRKISLDGTNWVSVGSVYTPGVTNATSDTIQPAVFSVPIYLELSVATTNSVQVGAVYLP